jgi:Kdo2-lipid IVA lauroyltransferase/acyltransferase
MYYIIYGLLYAISLLPRRVLYFIGDGLYGLAYYIIKYRRDMVMNNIAIAFPDKSLVERTRIAKDFYHNFIDTFIEAIEMLSMSDKEAATRVSFDLSGMESAYATGKSIQLHAGHNFNWEIVQWQFARNVQYPFLGVYMPISNKPLDKIFFNLRKRFGTILIPATNFKSGFLKYAKEKYILALAADQNPGNLNSVFWLYFFNRPTAFVAGPEKGARLNDTAVIFVRFNKTKRGFYHFTTELVCSEPKTLPEGELTRMFVRFVEEGIKINPSNYLWSHKRWKHAWKPEYKSFWADTTAAPEV